MPVDCYMTDWWISTNRFTCWLRTDGADVIVDAAPYLKRRIGDQFKEFMSDLNLQYATYQVTRLEDEE